MLKKIVTAGVGSPTPRPKTMSFGPWSSGLVTERQAEQLGSNECDELLNFILVNENMARTRDGSTLFATGCTGEVQSCDDVLVNSTWLTLIGDDDSKLYKNVAGTATLIGTMAGIPRFCGFVNKAMIFDGSYLKVYDGTSVTIAYDDGTGVTSPFQHNNRLGALDSTLKLGDGTNSRIAAKFTSQAWDAGYTIPPTTVYTKLTKAGTGGVGSVLIKIRKVSDDSILASKTIVADVTAISDGDEIEAKFSASEITAELSPSIPYYLSLEFTNTDGDPPTNHVLVHCSTVASAGVAYYYAAAAWNADTTKNPVMALKPGMPPKAVFGLVHAGKLFMIEGSTGDNPGWLWYSASGNWLAWSSADSDGYVSAIDLNADTFPIGAIASFYGSLYIFGTARQPYMGVLSGSSPSAYEINRTLHNVSADYKSTVVMPDDVYFVHPEGVSSISTTDEYGDIKAVTQTDNLRHTVHANFSTAAVAGYDPQWGLYLIQFDGYDYVIVLHTRMKTVMNLGAKQVSVTPASRWEFTWTGTPTAFGQGNGYLLVGNDQGKVYKMDSSAVEDSDTAVTYKLITNCEASLFGELAANRVSTFYSAGKFGAAFNVVFYKNHNRTSFHSVAMTLPWDTSTDDTEMDMDVDEMGWMVSPELYLDRKPVNFNFRAVQIGIEDVVLNGHPLFVGPIALLCDQIGGF